MNPVPLFLIIVSLPLLLGGCEKTPINDLRVDDFKVGDMVSVQTHKEILLPSGKVIKITPESIYVEWTREDEYGFEATDGIGLPRDKVGKDTFLIPLEEKALEVKEEAKLEEPVAETTSELDGVYENELEYREAIYYLIGSDTPYTGKCFRLYYGDGQKMYERNFKDGKPDGLFVSWYKNGQKTHEGNWKDGKREGLGVGWHENGQKWSEVTYKDGKEISEKYWNSKGEPVDSIIEALNQ